MKKLLLTGIMSLCISMIAGCHTCDVCDDCGDYDPHYGIYQGNTYKKGCSSCGNHYVQPAHVEVKPVASEDK